ncbi:hypothetical protein ACTFIT_006404 [Dictyostelium discoideum]
MVHLNDFLNFNNPPPCKTVVANIIREEIDANNWMFYIFGEDLGGSFGGARILPDINYPSFSVSLSIKNFSLYSFRVSKTVDVPDILILNYPYNSIGNFSLSWETINPQINIVDWVGDNLVFSGSYFGYNTTIIDIEIDGKKCLISKSTFYQINCTIAKNSLPSNSGHVTLVTVGDLSTQITLVYYQVNAIIECPNGSSYWQSSDCSIPYRICPLGSSVDSSIIKKQKKLKIGCNDENTEIDTIGDDDNSLNYISIKKDSKVLYDDRSTYMSSIIKSKNNESIIVAMNLPHFIRLCKIDPDFSVLLSTNFKSSCPSDNDVAVTVPIVSCSALAGLSIFIYRKKMIEAPFLKKMKKLSKQ